MAEAIAAICTGLTPGGIGVIRVSGDNSIEIVDKVFKNPSNVKLVEANSHTVHYGHIYDGIELIDEVMAIVLKAPRSFTTENTVEIDCHGGVYVLKKVLDVVLKNGARLAEPGEFTKRAFVNGRIDLTQAEAVMDLIASKNELSRKNSISQINGLLYKKIVDLRERILHELAFIEAALDDPEHISLDGFYDEMSVKINDIEKEISSLLATFDNGRFLKEGINTAIVGKPNVGKSSILNMLIGEDRAIVTNVAGTTRDALIETVSFGGITLNLIDTAGIHDTEDVVEKIGVEKSLSYVDSADLAIFIVDTSREFDIEDENIIKMLENKKSICLLNKSDLTIKLDKTNLSDYFNKHNIDPVFINTSATTGEGKEDIINTIKEMFFKGEININDELVITNLRQKAALEAALKSINNVKNSVDDLMPEDFLSIDLSDAYALLGEIIGEEVSDDLVEKIFKEFCMGK